MAGKGAHRTATAGSGILLTLFGVIFGILYLSAVLVAAPVWVPYVLGRRLYERAIYRNRVFLVAAHRRGWFEFVTNNVIPVLPPDIEVFWQDYANPRHKARKPLIYRLVRAYGISTPYLVVVRPWRNRVIPLHRDLKPLQQKARGRNPEVQSSVAALLEGVLESR